MGQSKIEVFRRILGDEQAAAAGQRGVRGPLRGRRPRGSRGGHARGDGRVQDLPRRRHPRLPGHRLLPHDPGRDHLRARLGRPDRPGPVPGRRRPRPAVAGPAADRAAVPARRGGQRARGGRRYRQRRRVRAARRGRDRGGRADRRRAPARTWSRPARRSSSTRSRASSPTSSSRAPTSAGSAPGRDEDRLGRQRDRDRGARGQRGSLGTRLVDLHRDVAGQQDAPPG